MSRLIPTNLITGFLGVGKTTAIRHLLQHKPPGEVWSVLVNEFGEIGIDGALLAGTGAHVREVAGGCICCVAGLPMKVALNMLIATTKPDRLLIEPTGLGHPEEIIATLTGEGYRELLDLRATLTLVDARKLADSRYTNNATFQDQLAVADVLIANKSDLCGPEDWQRLEQWLAASQPAKLGSQRVIQGALDPAWLNLPRTPRASAHPAHHQGQGVRLPASLSGPLVNIPEGQAFVRKAGAAGGFFSCGWVFRASWRCDFEQAFAWLSGLSVLRAKAVLATERGCFGFNLEGGVLSVTELEGAADSRIELIDNRALAVEQLERELLALAC